MMPMNRLRLMPLLGCVFAFLILCSLVVPSGAIGASLVIWTDDGQQHVHDLAILKLIYFSGEQFLVVTAYSTHQYPLESINRIDFTDYPTGVDDSEEMPDIVKTVHLFQNYPNPFNPATRIDFEIPVKGWVQLRIYSVKGQVVRTLIERHMEAGPQSLQWDGCDDSGNSVASGVYFYSLAAPGVQEGRKMILLR